MADWPPYNAGSARVSIRPQLASSFRADLKKLLAPVKESLNVTIEPKLKATFKADLQKMVKTASAGVKIQIEASPKLAAGFKTDLQTKVNAATKGITAEVAISAKLAPGFKTDLRDKLKIATSDILPDIRFSPRLAAGFKADLRTKLTAATNDVGGSIRVNVDLTRATEQMEAWRAAQGAMPLSLNVNVDTAAAVAQLLALRSLATSVGTQVNGIGPDGSRSGGFGSRQRLTGGIIRRPVQAVRLQVQLDQASVTRAEAEVANIRARLSQARTAQGDALDRVTLAEQRHNEVMSRSSSTDSQRLASTQRLAVARRNLADQIGRVTGLMGQEFEADGRLTRAHDNQNSLTRRMSAAWSGFRSAAVDALQDAAKSLFSFSSIAGIAKVALIGLAAVSLVPLLGQLVQAAGVIALLPAAIAGAVAVFATVKIGLGGVSEAFAAAGKAADSASEDAIAHAKAVQQAQKGQESAARGIAQAERGVRNAQKETLSAQKDLNQARKDALTNIEDLNRALGRASLTEEGAALAVASAQRELYRTFMDPNSDAIDRAQAQHNVKQALNDQDDLRRSNQDLAAKTKEANEKGVEGADNVVAAKDRVATASEGEADAQQALTDAYTALADAQQALTDTLNDGSQAAQEFDKAMAKLSPNARDFVQHMLDLKPAWADLRQVVQERLFDRLGDSLSNLANHWIPTLKTGLSGIAEEINGGLRRAFADLDTDATRSKVSTLFDNVQKSIGPVIDGIDNLVQGMLSLAEVGSDFLPGLSTGFAGMTQRFRDWAESDEGKQKFHDFLQDSLTTFGKIVDIVKSLGGIIGSIFKGSDDTGTSWLDSMKDTLDRWNKFLASPEGQQKIKDFFSDVDKTVRGIIGLLDKTLALLDRLEGYGKSAGNSPVGKALGVFTDDEPMPQKALHAAEGVVQMSPIYQGGKAVFNLPGGGADQWQMAKDAWEKYSGSVGEKAGSVVGWFSDIGSGIKDIGRGALEGLTVQAAGALSGFRDSLPGILESVANFTGGIDLNWNSIGNIFKKGVTAIVGDSVLGTLKREIEKIPGFFSVVVTSVGVAWAGLVDKIKGPVNAVIDVLNGFGDVWNKVADKLGLPHWDPISPVGATSVAPAPTTGPEGPARSNHATGGPITGPGGPTDDMVPINASAGEHMWTAAEVKAAGGHNAMYRMRQAALAGGGKQSRGTGFADGGTISTTDAIDPVQAQLWDLVSAAIPSAILTSAKRTAEVGSGHDYHMQGKAIDIGGPMDQIANWIYNTYPQSSELIHWPLNGWQNLKNGAPLDYGTATNEQHRDHVHWANADFLGNLSEDDRKSWMDRIRSGIGNVVGRGRDAAVSTLVGGPLRALADKVPEFPELGEFGQIPKAFARKLADQATQLASRALGGSSGGGGPVDYDPSGGGEQWRTLAISAMRRTGFNADDPQQVNAMLAQIMSESGGNPGIIQQVKDVNSGGNEGVGLLQVIPGTYAAYRDPSLPDDRTNPESNAVAALNYYKSRYGNDLTEQWGHGHGYDQGGIWPHGTAGWNTSGVPEAVLTNPQWRLFKQFADQLSGIGGLQALPQPLNGGTNADGTPGTFGVPAVPGVDTFDMVGKKAQDRFGSALETGANDLVSSTLGPLGLPDPRESGIWKGIEGYGKDLDSWNKAKAASAQATQALGNSGYQAAPAPVRTAESLVGNGPGGANGQGVANDYSTTINLYPRDTDDAYRKAEQIRDLRAIQYTASAGS